MPTFLYRSDTDSVGAQSVTKIHYWSEGVIDTIELSVAKMYQSWTLLWRYRREIRVPSTGAKLLSAGAMTKWISSTLRVRKRLFKLLFHTIQTTT